MAKKNWGVWITETTGLGGRWLKEESNGAAWRGTRVEANRAAHVRRNIHQLSYEARKHSEQADREEQANAVEYWKTECAKLRGQLEDASDAIVTLEAYRNKIREVPDEQPLPKGKPSFVDPTGMVYRVDQGTKADYRVYRFIRVFAGGAKSLRQAKQYLKDNANKPIL